MPVPTSEQRRAPLRAVVGHPVEHVIKAAVDPGGEDVPVLAEEGHEPVIHDVVVVVVGVLVLALGDGLGVGVGGGLGRGENSLEKGEKNKINALYFRNDQLCALLYPCAEKALDEM